MSVTCTKAFEFPAEDGARKFFPGDIVEDKTAAEFALAIGAGRETKPDVSHKRARRTPARQAVDDAPQTQAVDGAPTISGEGGVEGEAD